MHPIALLDCCDGSARAVAFQSPPFSRAEVCSDGALQGRMFDVYLNDSRAQLLVVAKGQSIPIQWRSGRWQRKKAAATVSDEIKMAIQRDGYYSRRLRKPERSN